MRRWHLVELEDLSWWPRGFRDAATDYLVTAIRQGKVYDGLVPRLASSLSRAGVSRVVDLCSGGGGPWPDLLPALREAGQNVEVCLTDKFPNTTALERASAMTPGLRFESESVSATAVPDRLRGFRTLFTSFHHFRPDEAKAILASVVRDREGILIAEATPRRPAVVGFQALVPLAVWLLTPRIRPFRWSRLFWTYLVPVLPVAILFDGVVSTLRTYNPDELLAMAREVGGDSYEWDAGVQQAAGSPFPIPYLIGLPKVQEDTVG